MKKMKMSAGRISAKPPANRYGNGESPSDASTCAGSVRLLTVRMTEANTSFQESTNVKMLAAARPGNANGIATRVNAPNGVHPNVNAASSRSTGTEINMLAVISTVVGNAKAVCTMATAGSVSYSPQVMNVTVRGTARMAIGNARVSRMSNWKESRPRNAKRANA